MDKLLAISIVAGILSMAAAVDANAATRGGTIWGPRGVSTFAGSRQCSSGSCSSQGSFTGPYGGTISHQSSRACAGGTCSASGTIAGPRGGTVSYSRTVTR